MNHLDVKFGVLEGRIVKTPDVVEEIAGEGGVRADDGAVKAEVGVVLGNFFVNGSMVDSDRDHGNPRPHGALGREEAAVDLLIGGGRDLIVIGGDELEAGVVERERSVAVVGNGDADRNEAVLDVFEAKEAAVLRFVAGFGGDGDVFGRVGLKGGILGRGFDGRRFAIGCGGRAQETEGEAG